MSDGPWQRGISVVVPVRGRVAEMHTLLASLQVAVEQSPEPAEIVVVDDSSPADAARHQANCHLFGARYLRGPRHVGAKRNFGVKNATYDLILFTDSDCRVPPDLLKRHSQTLREASPPVAAVAGPTVVEKGRSRTGRIMRWSVLLNDDLERPQRQEAITWATTTNLAVRRADFEAVGGFPSESLTVVAGEDVDFGIRFSESGRVIMCDPGSVVQHDPGSTDSLVTATRRLYTYGRSEQWLCTVHPHRRRFTVNAFTLAAATSAAALVGRRRWRRASVIAVPLTLGALLAVRAQRLRGGNRSATAVAETLACAGVDLAFDLGSFVAAWQLRRPDLLLTGFRPTDTD